MEFRNPLEENSVDDYERALSFCNLVTERVQEIVFRDSNTRSIDEEGFGFDFDFDFGRCDSTTDYLFPADDLFRHGRLLPVAPQRCPTESVQYSFFEKLNSENLRNWRNDSLESQSSFWSTSSSSSRSSQRKTHSGEILRHSNSRSKGNHKPSASGGKMSAKWRIMSLGLMKPPPMKLEDMRLRQGRTRNNIKGAKNFDLRRSVSCNYYKDPKLEQKGAKVMNFLENSRSVKEDPVVEKTPWLNGWKTLARFPSFNSCKTSSNVLVVENGRLQKAFKKAGCLQ